MHLKNNEYLNRLSLKRIRFENNLHRHWPQLGVSNQWYILKLVKRSSLVDIRFRVRQIFSSDPVFHLGRIDLLYNICSRHQARGRVEVGILPNLGEYNYCILEWWV